MTSLFSSGMTFPNGSRTGWTCGETAQKSGGCCASRRRHRLMVSPTSLRPATLRQEVIVLFLAVLLLLSVLPLQSDAPESLAHRYGALWNAHDATELGQLFADDADWMTASGTRLRGRNAIRDYLGQEHQTWARVTSMKVADVRVRSLTADAAVITFGWEINADDRAFKGAAMLVGLRERGRWQIVSGQVATTPAAR